MSASTATLISTPIGGISPPIQCNWVAAHNPVTFQYQRRDFAISAVNNNGGFNQIVLASPTLTPDYQAGDKITILSSIDSFITVAEITSIAFGVINTDSAWTGSAPPWAFLNVNSRRNWYLEVEIGTRTIRLTPDRAGLIVADISKSLQTFVNLNIGEYDYTNVGLGSAVNVRDTEISNLQTYRHREVWLGSSNNFSQAANIKIVNGAFQVGADNDCFYTLHTIFGIINAVPLPKFLTKFKQPRFWNGLPWDIRINIDSNFITIGAGLQFIVTYFDLQSNLISGGFSRNLSTSRYGLTQRLNNDYTNYAAAFMNVSIRNYSETLRCRILNPCEGGAYLRWRNTLGGVDYWYFDNFKNESTTVQGIGIFQPYSATISSQRSTGEFTGKRASDVLNLSAINLTPDEQEGLMDLLTSPKVDIYEGGKWFSILVQPGTFTRYESGDLRSLEFQAIKVDKQIQTW